MGNIRIPWLCDSLSDFSWDCKQSCESFCWKTKMGLVEVTFLLQTTWRPQNLKVFFTSMHVFQHFSAIHPVWENWGKYSLIIQLQLESPLRRQKLSAELCNTYLRNRDWNYVKVDSALFTSSTVWSAETAAKFYIRHRLRKLNLRIFWDQLG